LVFSFELTENSKPNTTTLNPEVCPNCGAEIPERAKACPECGSDEQTGWSEKARYDSLDLPEDNFDYDEFTKREFGKPKKSPAPHGIHWFWWVIAIGVLVALAVMFLW
jgi:ribosomal protein L40E